MLKSIVVAMSAVVLLGSCTSEAQEPTGREKELAAKSADFALKFHAEVARRMPGENVFVSPVSAFLALAMAASGAEGPTREEMAAALELKGWSRDEIDRGCNALLQWLQGAEPKIRLEVANSAWLRESTPFHAAYVKRLQNLYQAEANALDFGNPKSVDRINGWASDHTHGKITKAAPDKFSDDTTLLLINAVYFKGSWEHEFEKSATRPQDFLLADGKTKSLPFMHREGSYALANTEDFEAIKIPYGQKKRMSMVIVLPKGKTTLAGLPGLLAAQWHHMKNRFFEGNCVLELPRFRLDFEMSLKAPLESLGMKTAFTSAADFSGMSPNGKELAISSVLQKTFVDVNEEGTEAAAITVVTVEPTSVKEIRLFRVDRPFFCAIVDNATGALLFTGSIVEPK